MNRYELSQCPGIMSSYSYFAFEKDVVLQRRFDCNCHACLRATRPHEEESVDPMIDCTASMSSGAVCEALTVSITTRIAAFADLTIKLSRSYVRRQRK